MQKRGCQSEWVIGLIYLHNEAEMHTKIYITNYRRRNLQRENKMHMRKIQKYLNMGKITNTMENETEISVHGAFYVSIDGHIFIYFFALNCIQMYLLSYSDFGSFSPSQVAEFGTTHMYGLIMKLLSEAG